MKQVFPSISILIPELKTGDEVAWNQLCQGFQIGLIGKARFLLRTAQDRPEINADDLVQETLLKAWNQRTTFRGKSTAQFAKWLLMILRNTFVDNCRKPNPESSVATWFSFPADSKTPSANLISLEQEADLHACLADLTPKYQLVINLRIFEGLKFVEIAEITGCKLDTVASIYRRGVQQLMQLVRQRQCPDNKHGEPIVPMI